MERLIKFAIHAPDCFFYSIFFFDRIQRLFVLTFNRRNVATFFVVAFGIEACDRDRHLRAKLLAQIGNRIKKLLARGSYLKPELGFSLVFAVVFIIAFLSFLSRIFFVLSSVFAAILRLVVSGVFVVFRGVIASFTIRIRSSIIFRISLV